MRTVFNEIFKQLLEEYNLPSNLSFSVELPSKVRSILAGKILISDLGVTLDSFNNLYQATQDWENKSIIEDSENHFHVDWDIEPTDCKNAFMLGVQTLLLLAEKFQKEKVSGIRFWYSFQTPELAKDWARKYAPGDENDDHFISDRLSFFTRRIGEDVISKEQMESDFFAILIIDI